MGKKIIILTDTLSANGLLQNSLLNLEYEIMISKDMMIQPKGSEFYFLQNFDLIIYQQSMYGTLKESLLDNLALLDKPIVILTFESEQLDQTKYAANEKIYFMPYPISVSELASKLGVIFEETAFDRYSKEPILNHNENAYSFTERRQFGTFSNLVKTNKHHSFQLKDRTLIIDDWLIPLTKKEYQVLEYLIETEQRFFSSQSLCEALWNNSQQKNKQALLSNLINRIKQKIMDKTSIFEPFILNKKGIGYYLNQEFKLVSDRRDDDVQEFLLGNS